MPKAIRPLPLIVGGALVAAGPLALWDVARKQVQEDPGFYDLPFAVAKVPWWWAGDLFITMTYGGLLLVAYGLGAV